MWNCKRKEPFGAIESFIVGHPKPKGELRTPSGFAGLDVEGNHWRMRTVVSGFGARHGTAAVP